MKSIRAKLWVSLMLMIAIIIGVLWIFQIFFMESFYSFFEIRGTMQEMHQLVDGMVADKEIEGLGNKAKYSDVIEQYVEKKHITVLVTDKMGNTVYSKNITSKETNPGTWKTQIAEVEKDTRKGIEVKKEVLHGKFGYRSIVTGLPIIYDGQVQGTFIVSVPMAAVDDTVEILKIQLVFITIILLIIASIMSYRLANMFTKPILRIGKVADQYAKGDYSATIESYGKDEIGQLGIRMKEMGQELANREALQRELIANVSHELRTPLTLIQGYGETIYDVTGDNKEKRNRQLLVIIEESKRLSSIVENVLSLSRLQSGSVHMKMEELKLDEIMEDIGLRYEIANEKRMFKIRGLDTIKRNPVGDKGKIEQVFYNLLNNSFQYTEQDKEVTVQFIGGNDFVRVEVIDQGVGIDSKDVPYIFQQYYRSEISEKREMKKGTGLGLAIVKEILELHGARYGVESELEKGTLVWFELPCANSHISF